MSEYKRKKRHSVLKRKKPAAKHTNIVIEESFDDDVSEKASPLKVVKGKKLMRKRRNKVLLSTVAVIGIIIAVLSFVLPVGLFENINNFIATFGSGQYPIELGGNGVLKTVSRGNYYYVLTDTEIIAANSTGKIIYKNLHGFSKPVLNVSKTRAMIFDQGGTELNVYNLSKKVNEYKTDNTILCASLSDEGVYAVATTSNEYTSVVYVYDKNDKLLYQWNSAADIVNNIMLDSSGKRLAVSTINGTDGKLVSHIYILNYDSADYRYNIDLEDGYVLSLENFGKGFCVIHKDGYIYIDWKKYTKTEYKTAFGVDKFRKSSKGGVLVTNRENDHSDNRVIVFNDDGEKVTEFAFDQLISDIVYCNSHIYCMTESSVYIIDEGGNIISKSEFGYGKTHFSVISSDSVVLFSDNDAVKFDMKS